VASPLYSNNYRYLTWNYIFIRHMICVLLGASCLLWIFTFLAVRSKSSILAVHICLERTKVVLVHWNSSYASLKFFEPRNLLICFTYIFLSTACLVILKKISHASLRFIWESLNFFRKSLLLHLYFFWEIETLCSCASLRIVGAYEKHHVK
jgi:hypothetical protein